MSFTCLFTYILDLLSTSFETMMLGPQGCEFKSYCGGSPGGPVVRTWCFHCQGPGSIPGQENKVPQAFWAKKKFFQEKNKEKLQWSKHSTNVK